MSNGNETEALQKKSIRDLTPVICEDGNVGLFLDTARYDQGFRAARLLSESKGLIPKEYQGNAANCLLALNMAQSLGLTMQAFFNWTYPVNGKLGLEAKAIVTIANQSGMFKRGIEFEEIGARSDGDKWGFRAFAEDSRYGTTIEETFTIGDAKAAGWIGNTWWAKLPKMMLKYRSASFLIKLNRPELLGGMDVFEEMRDESAINKNITKEARALNDENITAEKPPTPTPRKKAAPKPTPKSEPVVESAKDTEIHEQVELSANVAHLQSLFNNPDYASTFSGLESSGELPGDEIRYCIANNLEKSAIEYLAIIERDM